MERSGMVQDRCALVTGGNRGIGAGVAVRLAQEGADVAFAYLARDDDAAGVAAQIRASGRRALPIQADLRDPGQITRLMDQVDPRLGPIDILINNAGTVRLKPFLDLALADWTDVLDTNLRAAFLCSQMAARGM